MKTADLTGAALDWAVWTVAGGAAAYPKTASGKAFLKLWQGNSAKYVHPSTDWAQGGPIIEREHLSIEAYSAPNDEGIACFWYASEDKFDAETWDAPTPLIAAMRCYCCAKLGEFTDIPEELCQQENS